MSDETLPPTVGCASSTTIFEAAVEELTFIAAELLDIAERLDAEVMAAERPLAPPPMIQRSNFSHLGVANAFDDGINTINA
mmetsp:Transcript_8861/g.13314  ORF Transcript_8861/g.13314 Transcript_8861/m.13314 type:complete len:81 (-) Transcript_8861:108-350(-)|eukprot:CAMPEP_0194093756 /NCGR_PEP_ID=MMETSP0149-20130528/51496_1 /TAXON_ID=122233 /ORGANISM="Chaetoceros debilis, Strain MM31A-1" /LENGTH=80 /DNA_ID=CAMNT_0038779171 /DNA_START=210 /DNA_END=452 /DNA_ORIENTATION=-